MPSPAGRRRIAPALLDGALIMVVMIAGVQFVRERIPKKEMLSRDEWKQLTEPSVAHSNGRTLVEFIDYECPACAAMESTLDSLESTTDLKLTRYIRHFPLPGHRRAVDAAAAAVCAAAQGKRKQMHTLLLERQATFDSLSLVDLAYESGINDTSTFRRCISSDSVRRVIDADVALGKSLRIRATPTFVLDREVSVGLAPDALSAFVRAH